MECWCGGRMRVGVLSVNKMLGSLSNGSRILRG
jgi:hypothetical protein